MGILSMLQEVLSALEVIIKVSAIMTLAIVIWGLMIYVAGILLDLLLGIVLRILEYILPDNRAARKDTRPYRVPEASPPPPPPRIDVIDRRLEDVATKEPEP